MIENTIEHGITRKIERCAGCLEKPSRKQLLIFPNNATSTVDKILTYFSW